MLGEAIHPPNVALVLGACLFFEACSRVAHWYIPASLKQQHAALDAKSVRDLEIAFASTVHAVVAVVMSTWIVLVPDPQIVSSEGSLTGLMGYSPRSNFTFGVSTGFFLWDLITILTDPSQFDVPFLIHAVVCFFSYLFGLFPFLHFYGAAFLLFEISTPALNVRKAMLVLGLKTHKHFDAIEKAFFVSFVTARLVLGLPMSFYVWKDLLALIQHPAAHNRYIIAFYLFANFASCSLNLFWFWGMVKKVLRRGGGKSRKKEE